MRFCKYIMQALRYTLFTWIGFLKNILVDFKKIWGNIISYILHLIASFKIPDTLVYINTRGETIQLWSFVGKTRHFNNK